MSILELYCIVSRCFMQYHIVSTFFLTFIIVPSLLATIHLSTKLEVSISTCWRYEKRYKKIENGVVWGHSRSLEI